MSSQRKKIALFIKKYPSNFSSGCVQQAIFTKMLLINCGYDVTLCSIEKDFKQFPDTGEPVKFIDQNSNLTSFKCAVFVSLHLESSTQKKWIDHFKKHLYCVSLICGNLLSLHQEEYVFNSHAILNHSIDNWYDEYWLLSSYASMLDYIKMLTQKPCFTVPYVWNSNIFTESMKRLKFDVQLDYHEMDRSKVNILIAEPNVSTHKTSLIPLLLAEEYYRRSPDRVHKIYLLCGKTVSERCSCFFEQLQILKDDILRVYDRIELPVMINLLAKQERPIVCLSHHDQNPYNFLHYEMLHMNIPIIHNSEVLKNNGYYYETADMLSVIELIEKARTKFYITETQRKITSNILEKVSVNNENNKNDMSSIMHRIFKALPEDNSIEKSPMYEQLKNLVSSFTKIVKFISTQPKIENLLFYNGMGIVICVHNESELTLLQCTLENLKQIDNHLRVEVVFSSEYVDKSSVKLIVHSVVQNNFNIEIMDMADEQTSEPVLSHYYTAITYSNFEKGILIKPGTILISDPDDLIGKHLPSGKDGKDNTFKYCSSFNKLSSLDETDSLIYQTLVSELDLQDDIAAPNAFINEGGVFFFNKKDSKCKKLLAIMCELYKINEHLCKNVNVLELACQTIYNNKQSKIEYDTYIYGLVNNNEFNGYGLAYKYAFTADEEEKYEYYVKNIPIDLDSSQNFNKNNKAMINLSKNNVEVYLNENKLYKIRGKAKAQKAFDLLN